MPFQSDSCLRSHSCRNCALRWRCTCLRPARSSPCCCLPARSAADTPRQIIAKAIARGGRREKDRADQQPHRQRRPGHQDRSSAPGRQDAIYLYQAEGSDAKIPVTARRKTGRRGQAGCALVVDDGQPLKDARASRSASSPATSTPRSTTPNMRGAMKGVLDLLALADPDRDKRVQAISTSAWRRMPEKLPALQKLAEDREGRQSAARPARSRSRSSSSNPKTRRARRRRQGTARRHRLHSEPRLSQAGAARTTPEQPELAKAVNESLKAIAGAHQRQCRRHRLPRPEQGSILLVAAIGLAITFGLMGVINMAHGELIAVGAYTTYVVQGFFATGVVLQIPTFVVSRSPCASPA